MRSWWQGLPRWLRFSVYGGIAAFALIQLVPYGWKHTNPPVTLDAPWPNAEAREIAVASCYDCHSNETDWPWYSYIAPQSWLVRNDVESGRDELNFSEWDAEQADQLEDAIELVEDDGMPLFQYTLLHPDGKLDDREKRVLIDALRIMGGEDGDDDNSGPGSGDDRDDRGGDNRGPGGGGDDD